MKTNLTKIANEVARVEGGEKKLGTPQIKEVLGCLGSRWREVPTEQMLREVSCIIERAGLRGRRYQNEDGEK